jgi:hypothetical protein
LTISDPPDCDYFQKENRSTFTLLLRCGLCRPIALAVVQLATGIGTRRAFMSPRSYRRLTRYKPRFTRKPRVLLRLLRALSDRTPDRDDDSLADRGDAGGLVDRSDGGGGLL